MADARAIPAREAVAIASAWRAKPASPITCPLCAGGDLAITDHSARPHAEWYRIACPACGLDQSLHIPMSTPTYGPD